MLIFGEDVVRRLWRSKLGVSSIIDKFRCLFGLCVEEYF